MKTLFFCGMKNNLKASILLGHFEMFNDWLSKFFTCHLFSDPVAINFLSNPRDGKLNIIFNQKNGNNLVQSTMILEDN